MAVAMQSTRPYRWPKQPSWLRVVREPTAMLKPTQITKPTDVDQMLRAHGADAELVEVFYVLLLDVQSRVRGLQEVTRGILNSTIVHPREVFRLAIVHGAAGIIVAHNHPSGDATPSGDDKAITAQLVEAGKLLDIPIYDHVIVGADGKHFSFAEAGLL